MQRGAPGHGGDNFVIGPGADPLGVEAMSPMQKVEANIAAIKLLRTLEAEGRMATADEMVTLSKYTGWGHSGQMFADDRTGRWKQLHDEVKGLLSKEDYESARRSTQYAHYTSVGVIRSLWAAVTDAFGFTGGSMLEPGAGVGHFLGLIPPSVSGRTFATAVEMDPTSAGIAKQLYQGQTVVNDRFEKVRLAQGSVDLAIGNPPFGDIVIADPKYDAIKPRIHDYFFLKSLDALRPGGLLTFITSKGTMDKGSTKARMEMAARADFVGAVRLPNTAFNKNAHTKVVTDVIVMQKRAEGAEMSEATRQFINTTRIEDPAGIEPIEVNRYFADNPGMVVGTIQRVKSGGLRGENEATVIADENTDIAAELEQRLRSLAPKVDRDALAGASSPSRQADEVVRVGNARGMREQAYHIGPDGKTLMQVQNGSAVPYNEKPAVVERLKAIVRVRDALRAAMDAQVANADDGKIAESRLALNAEYDRFVRKYGFLNAQTNVRVFRNDPDAQLIRALEHWDASAKTATKADIFTKRVINAYTPPTSATSAQDALVISLNLTGGVDPALMSRMYGKPVNETMKELGDRVYFTPDGRWETAETYLSGNVREKLAAAKSAAASEPAMERNVAALEAVQPKDVSWGEIITDLHPAMPHVGTDTVQAFAKAVLGWSVKIKYLGADAVWEVSAGWQDRTSAVATAEYGTQEYPAPDILQDVLNSREPTVRVKDEEGKYHVDEAATSAARVKARALTEKFRSWMSTPEQSKLAEKVHRRYNEIFNSITLPVYNGDHMTFPTLSAAWKTATRNLRPHQRAAVWRDISAGNTLFAHVVGAGKTAVMIASGMEQKRMGLIKKPLYVIPNHMVESGQFASDIQSMYPTARVLVATAADFKTDRRKAFLSRIATGDWDAVVMGHSTFGLVPMSESFAREFVNEQLADMREALNEVQNNPDLQGRQKKRTVKQIEKTIENMEKRLEKMIARTKKDDLLAFDELGVDKLYIDEAHNFKKPYIRTNRHNVKGIQTMDSARALDLWMKTTYFHGKRPGRGVSFATGTPVTNTLGEVYVMMRYLAPNMLRKAGIGHFDAWATAFGQTQTLIEREVSGGAWKETTRFNKFVNLPELMRQWRSIADVQTAEMLNLPRPELDTGKPIVVTVPQTGEQQAFTRTLQSRVEDVRGGHVSPKDDGMFQISNDGRKAGLDMRLKDPSIPASQAGLKLQMAADEIARIFKEGADGKLTQLVFCDLGRPRDNKPPPGQFGSKAATEAEAVAEPETEPDAVDTSTEDFGADLANFDETGGKFSTYDELRRLLVERGVPTNQIAFIQHYADKAPMRTWIQQQVRDGNIRILVGSTPLMGEGMNVQERLVALHHLDVPWMPSQVEQREGRILRQGNKNKKVRIYRYVTEGSFDAVMWQKVLQKGQFIRNVMSGSVTARTAEDIGTGELNADEAFAAAAGDPRILRRFELERKVGELYAQQAGWSDQTMQAARRAQSLREDAEMKDKKADRLATEIERVQKEYPSKWTKDTPGALEGEGKRIADKERANKTLREWIDAIKVPDGRLSSPQIIAPYTYRGFQIGAIAREGATGTIHVGELLGQGRPPVSIEFNAKATDLVLSMDSNIDGVLKEPDALRASAKRARTEADAFEARTKQPWPAAAEYEKIKGELDNLLSELAGKKKDDGAAGGATQTPPGTAQRAPAFGGAFFSDLPTVKRNRAKMAWDRLSGWFRTGEIDGAQYLMSGPGLPDPVLREAVVLGKLIAEAGARKFTAWSRAYAAQVGNRIVPHLRDIYQRVLQRSDVAPFRDEMDAADAVASLTDEQVQAGIDAGKGRATDEDVRGLRENVERALRGEKIGRPDLNNPGTSAVSEAAVKAVDEMRPQDVRHDEELERMADARMKEPAKARAEILQLAMNGGLLNDVDTRVARRIIDKEGLEAFASDDPQKQLEMAALTLAFRQSRGEVARALRAGGDLTGAKRTRAASRFALVEALTTPPASLMRKIKKLRQAARKTTNKAQAAKWIREANKLQKDWIESVRPKAIKRLRSFGIDLGALTDADLQDLRRVGLILRTIRGAVSGKGSWLREYVLSGMVSAVSSQAANVIGNVTNTVMRTFAQRLVEATINLAANDPESARFGEFVPMFKAVVPALAKACRNTAIAWDSEMAVLENEVDPQQMFGRGGGHSIPSVPVKAFGKTLEVGGRQVRIPLRALLAADEFMKAINFTLHSAAVAYRAGKAEGLTGDKLESFIEDEASNVESRSSAQAVDYAEELAFQDEPSAVGRNLLKVREDVPGLWMFVPFIKTVDRIYASVLKTLPTGLLNVLNQHMRDGSLYTRGKKIQDAAQLAVGVGLLLAVMGLLDDDDPLITGNVPRGTGARNLAYSNAPPQSIRIGGKWYSYSRIEPLAGVLATLVDGLNTIDAIKRGQNPLKAVQEGWSRFVGQTQDKTFLRGISDVLYALEQGDASKLATGIGTSLVPNIVKVGARSSDDMIREQRTWGTLEKGRGGQLVARLEYGLFPSGSNAPPPKVDLWGREVKKFSFGGNGTALSDWLYRMAVPVAINPSNRTDPLDRLILNWNNANPDEVYAPEPVATYLDVRRADGTSKRLNMTDAQYHDFAVKSGELAHDLLSEIKMDPAKPTRDDITTIRKVVEKARRATLVEMFSKEFEKAAQETSR